MVAKKKGQEAETTKDKSIKPNATKAQVKGTDVKSPAAQAPRKEVAQDSGSKSKAKSEDVKLTAKTKGKEGAKESSKGGGVPAFIENARQFLKEVAVEFKKISWPAKQQVIQETYSVLFLVTVITLMVLGFDWVLGHGVFGPIEHWARLHGGGVGHS